MSLLNFMYNEKITLDEIESLLVRACIVEPEDHCGSDMAPITKALFTTYREMAELQEVELKTTDSPEESERLFQKYYFRAFPEAEGADGGMGWYPDTMPYEGNLPRKIVATAGKAIGERDKAQQKAWYAYAQKNLSDAERHHDNHSSIGDASRRGR